jgi:FkbM family methyltransferase
MVSKYSKPPIPMQIYSRLLHYLPLAGGLTKLSFNSLTHSQFAQCNGLICARMRNGVCIEVDPHDYDGRVLYLFGTNDPKVQTTAQALLCPGDRFLDIGANYSSIGLLAAHRVGSTGQVHLFEPQEQLCQRVSAAIAQAGLTNVQLHPVALMDCDSEMKIARPTDHSGMATLIESTDRNNWDSQIVPVRNIATYIPPLIGDNPFGVKLDVEGAEPYLMPWLLKQPNLRFLIFEAAQNQKKLWDFVQASGLSLYGLRRLVFAKQIQQIESFEQMKFYHDLVAIRIPDGLKPPRQINPHKLAKMIEQHKYSF